MMHIDKCEIQVLFLLTRTQCRFFWNVDPIQTEKTGKTVVFYSLHDFNLTVTLILISQLLCIKDLRATRNPEFFPLDRTDTGSGQIGDFNFRSV